MCPIHTKRKILKKEKNACHTLNNCMYCTFMKIYGECFHIDKDKDLFIGPQEFVVGYSKAPEQPQSSARPICHSHAMTRTGYEPATTRIAA